jgi:hypothetical protein
LGDAEGQNLIVDLYSGEGRPAGFADLARRVVKENPEVWPTCRAGTPIAAWLRLKQTDLIPGNGQFR